MKRKASTQKVRKPRTRRQQSQSQQQVFLARRLLSAPDVKASFLQLASTGITTAAPVFLTITDPTLLVPGVAQNNQYVGSRINPVNLTVRYSITMGDAVQVVRVGLFQFTGAGTASAGNCYETTINPLSPIKSFPSNAFNCLSDKMYSGSSSAAFAWQSVLVEKIYIKKNKLLPIVFTAGGASITAGQIVLVALSDSAIAPNPAIVVYSIMKYLDS